MKTKYIAVHIDTEEIVNGRIFDKLEDATEEAVTYVEEHEDNLIIYRLIPVRIVEQPVNAPVVKDIVMDETD